MSTQNSVPGKGPGQIVADVLKTMPETSVVQARVELDQGHVVLLLDAREPAEWEKGQQIAPARSFPLAGVRLTIDERNLLYGIDPIDVLGCFCASLSFP